MSANQNLPGSTGPERLQAIWRSLLRFAFALLFVAGALLPAIAQEVTQTWGESLARQAHELLGADEWFAAAVVQDGVLHPVAGQRITLRRAPFGIVIVTHEPDGLLVNASVHPDIYRGVVKERTLDEILEEPDMFMGAAEGLFNDERTLFVSDDTPHYIFYTSPEAHRYDEVRLIDGAVVGHRLVEYLWDMDGAGFGGLQGTIPVHEMGSDLYLSFFHTRWQEAVRVENQSGGVGLTFK